VGVGISVGVAEGVVVGVAVGTAVGVQLGVGVGGTVVGVQVGVDVGGTLVGVRVGTGVGVAVGVWIGVSVGVGVEVATGVAVGVGVNVELGTWNINTGKYKTKYCSVGVGEYAPVAVRSPGSRGCRGAVKAGAGAGAAIAAWAAMRGTESSPRRGSHSPHVARASIPTTAPQARARSSQPGMPRHTGWRSRVRVARPTGAPASCSCGISGEPCFPICLWSMLVLQLYGLALDVFFHEVQSTALVLVQKNAAKFQDVLVLQGHG